LLIIFYEKALKNFEKEKFRLRNKKLKIPNIIFKKFKNFMHRFLQLINRIVTKFLIGEEGGTFFGIGKLV